MFSPGNVMIPHGVVWTCGSISNTVEIVVVRERVAGGSEKAKPARRNSKLFSKIENRKTYRTVRVDRTSTSRAFQRTNHPEPPVPTSHFCISLILLFAASE